MESTPFGLGNGRNFKMYPGSTILLEKTSVSYAAATKGNQVAIEYDALPKPGFRGDYPTIKIPKRAYERGLDYCKHSLIGRMEMTEIDIEKLKSEAALKWKPQGCWNITPLGKGFLHIKLDNGVDFDRVWSGGPWKFAGQLMRLSEWQKGFKPDSQKQTNALIWVKFPRLPLEFWDAESIMSIARGVGYPLKLDEATEKKKFGFYAHVLVDVDLTKTIPDQVLVEHDDGEFWQDVQITKLPKFCSHCKMVGHLVAECKRVRTEIGEIKGKETTTKKVAAKGIEKELRKGKPIHEPTVWKKKEQINAASNIASTSVDITGTLITSSEIMKQKTISKGGDRITSATEFQNNKFQALAAIEDYSDEEDLDEELDNEEQAEETEHCNETNVHAIDPGEMVRDPQSSTQDRQETDADRPLYITILNSGTKSNPEMVHDTQDHIGSAKREGTLSRSFERVSATPDSAESNSATAATSKSIERGRTIEEAAAVIQMMGASDIADEDEIEADDAATDIEGGN
ncbi:Non-LTR retrolelement reverse transcriptase-like protein, related, partial [Thalictrum thalictroides]